MVLFFILKSMNFYLFSYVCVSLCLHVYRTLKICILIEVVVFHNSNVEEHNELLPIYLLPKINFFQLYLNLLSPPSIISKANIYCICKYFNLYLT